MIKCIIGYSIVEGLSAQEYDRWLYDIHTPDLLANPYLDRLVFNTVIEAVKTLGVDEMALPLSRDLYRVAEMHFRDMAAYEKYRAWFQEHPIPTERGPHGRTNFKFYVLTKVEDAGERKA